MKGKAVFLAAILVLTIVESTGAEEGKPGITIEENKLDVTFDATYVSRYIWRGFDSYPNNHSAIQPSVDLDLYGTGWGVNVWWSRANTSGFENSEEIDYTLYYGKSLFEGKPYTTDYKIG
ncbi:MAG: hypothetical protein NTX52_11245, partial [Planctomycetota bacterium]|nr:hypothetical protein [Planctomycetota bacterium]